MSRNLCSVVLCLAYRRICGAGCTPGRSACLPTGTRYSTQQDGLLAKVLNWLFDVLLFESSFHLLLFIDFVLWIWVCTAMNFRYSKRYLLRCKVHCFQLTWQWLKHKFPSRWDWSLHLCQTSFSGICTLHSRAWTTLRFITITPAQTAIDWESVSPSGLPFKNQ